MAKFKKKKFKSEKPDPEEKKDDLPEIEADESVENTESESEPAVETPTESKPDPTEDPIDKSATKKLTDRLFWLRIAVSIAGGVIAASTVTEPLPHPISKTDCPTDNLPLLICIARISSLVIGTDSVLSNSSSGIPGVFDFHIF